MEDTSSHLDHKQEVEQLRNELDMLRMTNTALEEELKRFELLTYSISDVLWTFDLTDLHFTYVSSAVLNVHGYTQEEFLQMPLGEIISPNSYSELEKLIIKRRREFLNTEESKEYNDVIHLKHKDGHFLWAEIRTFYKQKANYQNLEIVGVTRDISDQIKAEEVLLRNERLLNDLQELSNTGGWEYTAETEEIYWTPQLYEIHEIERDNSINHISESVSCYSPEDKEQVLQDFLQCLNFGASYDKIFKIKTKKNNLRWIRTRTKPIYEENNVVKVIGSVMDITERKHIEEALMVKNLAIESSINAVCIADLDGYITYVNGSFLDLWGYKRLEDVLGRSIKDFWSGSQYIDEIAAHLYKDEKWIGELVGRKLNGNEMNILVKASLVINQDKEPIMFFAAFENITEHKLSVRSLRDSEALYQSLVNSLPFNVYRIDTLGRLTFVNKFLLDQLQLESSDVIGKTAYDFYPESLAKKYRKDDVNVLETGKPLHANEENVDPKTGELNYVEVLKIPVFGSDGRKEGVQGIFWDITERKKAEIELKEAKDFAESLIETANAIVVVLDSMGNIEVFNKAAEGITGYTSQELQGRNWFEILVPKDRYPDVWNEFLKLQEGALSRRFENPILTKSGEERYIVWQNSQIFHGSKVQGAISFGIDITERIQTERELVRAKEKAEQSDRLKTEFLNNISHEVRTPLNGILGFSDLLGKENITEERRKHYISIVQNSGQQLLRIIDDILEISRLETKQVKIQLEEMSLNDLLLELFAFFDFTAKSNQIPLFLYTALSDEESRIYSDANKLRKVLSNLIENALKFTHEGYVEFGYDKNGSNIDIYIKDTGVGIKKEMQEVIFERFSQEEKELSQKIGGLGLGLSIAKENTELLGGKIKLISEKGKGAKFVVTIPYKPVDTKFLAKYANSFASGAKRFTILIVEDEEINLLFLDTLIKNIPNFDVEILHAKDGLEAISICMDRKDIALILMDIKMPEMNGYDATVKIREFRKEVPIIAQTAYSSPEDQEKALLVGCTGFVSKPISEYDLHEIFRTYLGVAI